MREKRFVVTEKQSSFGEEIKVIVDSCTGVNYLTWFNCQAGGITPLLDRDGRPVITSPAQLREE